MKKHLAIFRCGANSLHRSALGDPAQRSFDYALSWFGDGEPEANGALFVHHQKGAKWPGLYETMLAHWATVSQYEYVWLPDDDLLCKPEDVDRMFRMCETLGLELAQPALTVDSYFAHIITLQHSAFMLRFTDFVEVMAPVFSRSMLARIMPTLDDVVSGYGLDQLWPRMSRMGKVAVIDETPVKHTRPLGGPNYKFSKDAGIPPHVEGWLCNASHFVDQPWDLQINFGGILKTGETCCLSSRIIDIEALFGSLLTSMASLPLSAVNVARYLSNHYNYVRGNDIESITARRDLVPVALNQVLKPRGIEFANRGAAEMSGAA